MKPWGDVIWQNKSRIPKLYLDVPREHAIVVVVRPTQGQEIFTCLEEKPKLAV